MPEKPGGEMMADYITKDDLNKATDDIKEHIATCLKPIIKNQEDHETILTGRSKMNGLVGGFRNLQTKIKVVYGLFLFIAAGLVKIIFFS